MALDLRDPPAIALFETNFFNILKGINSDTIDVILLHPYQINHPHSHWFFTKWKSLNVICYVVVYEKLSLASLNR